jgi:hypothetical protein
MPYGIRPSPATWRFRDRRPLTLDGATKVGSRAPLMLLAASKTVARAWTSKDELRGAAMPRALKSVVGGSPEMKQGGGEAGNEDRAAEAVLGTSPATSPPKKNPCGNSAVKRWAAIACECRGVDKVCPPVQVGYTVYAANLTASHHAMGQDTPEAFCTQTCGNRDAARND